MHHPLDSLLAKPLSQCRRGVSQWSRRALMFACIVVFVNAIVGDGGLIETLRAREQYAAAVASLAKLQRENTVLAETARRLETDRRTIEGVVREELGFVRPGELIFMLGPVR